MVVVCKPILVFSLGHAEQYPTCAALRRTDNPGKCNVGTLLYCQHQGSSLLAIKISIYQTGLVQILTRSRQTSIKSCGKALSTGFQKLCVLKRQTELTVQFTL